jgi:hypothetical protein
MKQYNDYMNSIKASEELHEKIMQKTQQKQRRPVYRYAAAFAGLAVIALSVWAISRVLEPQPDQPFPYANPTTTTTEIRLSPPVPGVRLTLDEARLDAAFGAFLPAQIPDGFVFEGAQRFEDGLFVSWSQGLNTLTWHVRMPTEYDHVISPNDREKFDVSLYEIPWGMTVPEEFFYYFQSPVFLAAELTLEAVEARARWEEARGYVWGHGAGWRVSQFGVLHGDVLVQISAGGIAPQALWEMLGF